MDAKNLSANSEADVRWSGRNAREYALVGISTQMQVKKSRDLVVVLLRLRRAHIDHVLCMRLSFPHLKHRLDARLAQLAMHANCVRQVQITRAAGQNCRREAMHVAID